MTKVDYTVGDLVHQIKESPGEKLGTVCFVMEMRAQAFTDHNGVSRSKAYYAKVNRGPVPHPHANAMMAWALGAPMETSNAGKIWLDSPKPDWTGLQYRVKQPAPKVSAAEVERQLILAEMTTLQKRIDALPVG